MGAAPIGWLDDESANADPGVNVEKVWLGDAVARLSLPKALVPMGSWLTVPAAGGLLVRLVVRTLPVVCVPPAGVFEDIPGVVLVPPGCVGAACPPPATAAADPANSSDVVARAAPIMMANRFNGFSY